MYLKKKNCLQRRYLKKNCVFLRDHVKKKKFRAIISREGFLLLFLKDSIQDLFDQSCQVNYFPELWDLKYFVILI